MGIRRYILDHITTSKSHQFSFIPKCPKIVNLAEFPKQFRTYCVHRLSGLKHKQPKTLSLIHI